MRYTLNFLENQYQALRDHLFADPGTEAAAYLFCRAGAGGGETRLMVREVVPVPPGEVTEASGSHMSIPSQSVMRALKRADRSRECFLFAHSHPFGPRRHSDQDDREEALLFRTAYIRVSGPGPHGSVVLSPDSAPSGRVWLDDGTAQPIERIRVLGRSLRYYFHDDEDLVDAEFFDRQIRAFGKDVQRVLSRLRAGIVGLGGTGSAVLEQVARLGVGTIIGADGDHFDATNVNRVYGSSPADQDLLKTDLATRTVERIGLGTRFTPVPRPITYASAMRELVGCDVIFGCTDDQWGRSLLGRLALYYHIPVLDMGVALSAEDDELRSVDGRVTVLMPGAACLYCRGRITAARVSAESRHALNPEEAERLRAEGYLEGLDDPAPAVIPFTTAIASSAVTEFLLRLTNAYPHERESTEVLHLIDRNRIRTNSKEPSAGCLCATPSQWGKGDTSLFLDTTWRPE